MRRILAVIATCSCVTILASAPAPDDDPPQLVYVSKRAGNADIMRMNADGTGVKNLTNGKGNNSYPIWSPDGKKIAFASDRDGAMNIYVMDADGSNVKALTKGNEASRVPSWSPDGKKLAFCRATPNGTQIFTMDTDGGNVKQIGNGEGYDPAWSPDGKKILFTSTRDGRGFHIYVMDADGANTTALPSNGNVVGFVYPSWSPDGKKIAWTDNIGASREIYVADPDGKNAKQITKLGGTNTYSAWTPDGKKITFFHFEGNNNGTYYTMDADGTNMKELIKDEPPVEGGRPRWRPK